MRRARGPAPGLVPEADRDDRSGADRRGLSHPAVRPTPASDRYLARLAHVGTLPQHPIPPHDDAGYQHQRRHQPQERPDRPEHRRVAPSAEVQPRQPREDDVTGTLAENRLGIGNRIHEVRERLRHAEIEPGDAPHQHEQKQPEPDRAVQVPVETPPSGTPLDPQAPLPAAHSRPPHHGAAADAEAEHRAADSVPEPARPIEQQLVVQPRQPQYEVLTLRHRVAKILAGVRIEETLLLLAPALDPDLDRRIAPRDPITDPRDLPPRIRAL